MKAVRIISGTGWVAAGSTQLRTWLPMYDPAKSEHENMLANKFYRVYDCGRMVFRLDPETM